MKTEIELLKATFKAVLDDLDAHAAVIEATTPPVSKEKLEKASAAIRKAEDALKNNFG